MNTSLHNKIQMTRTWTWISWSKIIRYTHMQTGELKTQNYFN